MFHKTDYNDLPPVDDNPDLSIGGLAWLVAAIALESRYQIIEIGLCGFVLWIAFKVCRGSRCKK